MADKKLPRLSANVMFRRVSGRKSNSQIIDQMSKRVFLVEAVVSCLKRIESRDEGINWWQDSELMNVFGSMYKAGVLPLPVDPVERIRWIALLCIKTCEFDKFSYGNLLIPLDYLPDNLLDDSYGISVLTSVKSLRKELKEKGWYHLFGW